MSGARIPADMQPEFERFRRDLDAAWRRWIEEGAETAESFAQAKRDVAAWMASVEDSPDQPERLRAVFAYWRRVAARGDAVDGSTVAVRPEPQSLDMHTRWAERDHARATAQPTRPDQETEPCR